MPSKARLVRSICRFGIRLGRSLTGADGRLRRAPLPAVAVHLAVAVELEAAVAPVADDGAAELLHLAAVRQLGKLGRLATAHACKRKRKNRRNAKAFVLCLFLVPASTPGKFTPGMSSGLPDSF